MEKGGKVDLSNVGMDKAIQDPQKVVESAFGTYKDPVTPGTLYPNTKAGPEPSPFGSMK